jgi:hypothetical protein
MIKNFFTIAIRNIFKHKAFSFINVTGLAVGLAASLLILLWVQDELSFERFNKDGSDIYRVEEDQFYSGERYHVTVTPFPSGPVWKEKTPEISEQTRINPRMPRMLFRQGDKVFYESSLIAADSSFLEMFSFQLLSGDKSTVLNAPHSILLTEKLARKYFGDNNPIGETITLENKYEFMVTGVLKELPKNSMFTFEGVLPFSFLKEIGAYDDNWGSNSIFTFIRIDRNADIQAVNKKLTDIVIEHEPETTTKYLLFPLLDIHLHQQFGFTETKGAVIVVFTFTLIAIFVLLIGIASIFMFQQVKFMLEKDLGFNKNNLIGIQMADNMKKKYYSLKSELSKETLIQGVTASLWNPVMMGSNSGGASWEGKDPEKNVLIGTNTIDYDYLKTMQMELVSGRDFSRDYPSDIARDTTGNFLVNEEVVKLMNIGDPAGKSFRFMGLNGRIIGVMKNFHFKGADQPIEPLAFALTDTSSGQ